MFPTEVGTPCNPRSFLRVIEVAASKAGIADIGIHTLRHSAATAWLANGVHIRHVADLLGHSTSASPATFTPTAPETAHAAQWRG